MHYVHLVSSHLTPLDGVGPSDMIRHACGHVDVAATLTLNQPGGGRLCPPYTGVHTKFWKPQAHLMIDIALHLISFLSSQEEIKCNDAK